MPISYVGSHNAGNAFSGTVASVIKPAGATTDDFIVVFLAVRLTGAGPVVVTPPSGAWTLLEEKHLADEYGLFLYYRPLLSDEPATWDFTWGGSNRWGHVATVWRGVNLTTPLDTALAQQAATGLTATGPSVTTTVAGAWQVFVAYLNHTTASYGATTPTFSNVDTISVGRRGVIATREIAAAGATGDATQTWNFSQPNFGWNFALRPAGAGGTDATVTPARLNSTVTIPTPSIQSGGSTTVSPAQVAAIVNVSAATVITGSGATAAPALITCLVVMETAWSEIIIEPARLACSTTIPTPVVSSSSDTSLVFQDVVADDWSTVGGTPQQVLSDDSAASYLLSPLSPTASVVDGTLPPAELPAGDVSLTLNGDHQANTSSVAVTLRDGGSTVATATVSGALSGAPGDIVATFAAADLTGITEAKWHSGTLVMRMEVTAS